MEKLIKFDVADGRSDGRTGKKRRARARAGMPGQKLHLVIYLCARFNAANSGDGDV